MASMLYNKKKYSKATKFYSEAIKIEPDFEIGEEVSEEIKLADFGRRTVMALRQNLIARVIELEKDGIYNKYKDRVGTIITGEVYQIWKRETLLMDDEGNELVLPKNEQIPSDYFRKGDTVRGIIKSVEFRGNKPIIILSRTASVFLEKLFVIVFSGLNLIYSQNFSLNLAAYKSFKKF